MSCCLWLVNVNEKFCNMCKHLSINVCNWNFLFLSKKGQFTGLFEPCFAIKQINTLMTHLHMFVMYVVKSVQIPPITPSKKCKLYAYSPSNLPLTSNVFSLKLCLDKLTLLVSASICVAGSQKTVVLFSCNSIRQFGIFSLEKTISIVFN